MYQKLSEKAKTCRPLSLRRALQGGPESKRLPTYQYSVSKPVNQADFFPTNLSVKEALVIFTLVLNMEYEENK